MTKGLVIAIVEEESIAAEMELAAGDRILAVNGQEITDIIDFQYLTVEEEFSLLVEKSDGEVWELEIEKDPDEILGIGFENISADGLKMCKNHCLFCFVSQMPSGMRRSLYDRDDDYRLSLSQGSFITLTNLSEQEFDRIIRLRLHPLYISVHAWDPKTRIRMLRNPEAGKLPEQLKRLAAAGLNIHAQVVLIPGCNDGEILTETVTQLQDLYPAVQSIAIVPVGLTKFREKLPALRGFTSAEAQKILRQGQQWQESWREKTGRSLVYYSDEFYVLAGWEFPPAKIYDDFSQLENGIGMAAKFTAEVQEAWHALPKQIKFRRVHVITGVSAARYFQSWAERLQQRVQGLEVIVHVMKNHFLGSGVTVAGLLTASDIVRQMKDLKGEDFLIPTVMLKSDQPVFLDDHDVNWLAGQINGRAHIVENHGQSFLQGIIGRKLEV